MSYCSQRTTLFSAALLFLALLLSLPAAAQQAQLAGVVRDPHQAHVAGALVQATSLATKQVYTVRSDAQGNYTLPALPAGDYSVEVTAKGFKPAHLTTITLSETASITQNVTLTLSSLAQSVDVNANLEMDVRTQTPAALLGVVEGVKNDSIVFSASDIQALHPTAILDVFQQVPSAQISIQGKTHPEFIALRGGNVQIVIDGVYVSQTDRLMVTLPVQEIESMTIVRDSTALSIGPLIAVPWGMNSNAPSGVGNQGFIVIKTKRAGKLEAGTVASGASYGTAMGHLYAGSKTGNWDYRGSYTYMTSEGRNGWNMAYRNAAAFFHGGYTTEKTKLDFLYYGARGYRNLEYGMTAVAGSGYQVGQMQYTANDRLNYENPNFFALNITRNWNANNRTVLQYGFDGFDVKSLGSRQNNTEGDLDLKHTIRWKNQTITGGGQTIKYIAPFGIAGASAARYDYLLASWYAQDEYHAADNRLTLDGGVRSDKLHTGWNTSAKKADDSWSSAYMTLAFGASYKITPKTTVGARYAFVDTPVSGNYESAASLPNQQQNRGEFSIDSHVNPYFNPRGAIYAYDTANAVTTGATNCPSNPGSSSWQDAAGNWIYCVTSAPDVKTAGFEFGFTGRILKSMNYNTNYSYIATDNKSDNLSMTHHFVNASLNYRQRNYFGNFSMVYVGPQHNTLQQPGATSTPNNAFSNYSRFDANGGLDFPMFTRQATLTVFGRNLGDSNYSSMFKAGNGTSYTTFPDPGFQWGVELALKIF